MKGFDSYGNKEHETKQGLKTSSCECAWKSREKSESCGSMRMLKCDVTE